MLRVIILLLLSGCAPSLVVYTDYHTQKDLASYNVGTPDPLLKSCDCMGQSLVFEWFVPKEILKCRNVRVETYIRLRDRTECYYEFPIPCVSGHKRWDISGNAYFQSGGIFTFYATLFADDEILRTAIHPLYTPLIEVNAKKDASTPLYRGP